MKNSAEIKELVKSKYGEIALANVQSEDDGCCGSGAMCGCGSGDFDEVMAEDYQGQEGYVAAADLSLGCGLPTAFAELKEGQTVLDLGSGAGNDVFVASKKVGDTGKVIGVDMTPAMIDRANLNKEKVKATNVEFRLGDIESLPVDSNSVDVVISNCVLNLVPDKQRAFSEVFRVLRPGGYFTISDIVLEGELSPAVQAAAEFYAGCVSGALQKSEYLNTAVNIGFQDLTIEKEKVIKIPQELLDKTLSMIDERERKLGDAKVVSITLKGRKH